MRKIGIISDTHGYWDEKFADYFSVCDEIWHAGDFGSEEILYNLEMKKPVRGVFGNMDDYLIRLRCPEILRFKVEDVDVLMTHIGGYPGAFAPKIHREIYTSTPTLFVCGHSHILKVMFDKTLKMWCVNPGAAGKTGYHTFRTIIRLAIDGSEIRDLEVIEFKD